MLMGVAIVLACITPIISQTRGNSIFIVLSVIVFLYLSKKCEPARIRKRNYLAPLLYFIMILLIFLSAFVAKDFLKAPISRLGYRFSQINQSESGIIGGFIKMGGGRVPEALVILEKFAEHPTRILTGFGLGGEIQTNIVSKHFVHIGLAEILFRAGGVGLIFYVWIIIYCTGYALSRIKDSTHFLLPALIATINLISIFLLGGNWLSWPIYTAPIFAGMLKIDRK
jgi:hypothetical protein